MPVVCREQGAAAVSSALLTKVEVSMRSSRIGALFLGFAWLAACSDSSGPDEQVPQCTAADANGNVNAMVPFQARTFRGAEVGGCIWVTGSGAN